MRIATVVTAASLALLGTVAMAQSVNYDFDRSANFTRFKTYSWVRGTPLADPLNHARVVRAIESQLAAKGLSKVETAADVLVAYHASFDRNLQINGLSSGWAGPAFGGTRSGSASTQEIVTGTIAIDMSDATSNTVVWRGLASANVDPGAKPEKREKNINKAAEKVFKNYPPKP